MGDSAHLSKLVDAYLLANDLDATTERWYLRVASVFRKWYGSDPIARDVTPEVLSRFLRDMRDGHSTYYCKSLRSGLLAVLGERIDRRRVRAVRLKKLRPASWTSDQIEQLLASVTVLPWYKRTYYRKAILVAWHSGLSKGDLHRVTKRDISHDGTLLFERHKTGESVVAWLPTAVVDELPDLGPILPKRWSDEQFRKDFKRIVTAAGLVGTFKTLRKSSGTQAEILTGRGHEHLANSRKVFETHYLDRNLVHREPVKLPRIG